MLRNAISGNSLYSTGVHQFCVIAVNISIAGVGQGQSAKLSYSVGRTVGPDNDLSGGQKQTATLPLWLSKMYRCSLDQFASQLMACSMFHCTWDDQLA